MNNFRVYKRMTNPALSKEDFINLQFVNRFFDFKKNEKQQSVATMEIIVNHNSMNCAARMTMPMIVLRRSCAVGLDPSVGAQLIQLEILEFQSVRVTNSSKQ